MAFAMMAPTRLWLGGAVVSIGIRNIQQGDGFVGWRSVALIISVDGLPVTGRSFSTCFVSPCPCRVLGET